MLEMSRPSPYAPLDLEVGEKEPFVSRTMAGAPEKGDRIVEHLLNGQQRLTALWRSLTDDYPDRTYFVQMTSDEQRVAPTFVLKYNIRAVRALGSARSDLTGLDEVVEGGAGDVQDFGDRGLGESPEAQGSSRISAYIDYTDRNLARRVFR